MRESEREEWGGERGHLHDDFGAAVRAGVSCAATATAAAVAAAAAAETHFISFHCS